MSNKITQIFKAVADPTRREIFQVLVLASTALSVNQVCEHFDISRQGVTKHIKVLEEAGLVTINTQGRERFCQAHPHQLKAIHNWVAYYEKYWDDKLDKLGGYLDSKA